MILTTGHPLTTISAMSAQTAEKDTINPYKCQGTNKEGNPCKSTFVSKEGWCIAHDPDRIEEVQKWRERGADNAKRKTSRKLRKQVKHTMQGNDPKEFLMFVRSGMLEKCRRGEMSRSEAARHLNVSERKVSYYIKLGKETNLGPRLKDGWKPSAAALKRLFNFREFRDEYFELTNGDKFITKDFHIKWINALLRAIRTGGRQMILSPPRHGKTELLMHFVIWLICRNPNIRVIWITGTAPIGKRILSAIKSELEHNEKLRLDYLPPTQQFKPGRQSGLEWGKQEIEVACRKRGIKSPTIYVCGRDATLPSRDADFIVMDDIIDIDSARSDGQRQSLREHYAASIASRKEEHTALIDISSRVHPADIHQDFIDSQEWECIVESAHDIECQLDPDDYELHVDCVLFPEIRSYKWLMEQKSDLANLPGIYELVYLNNPGKTGVSVFVTEIIEDCYDPRLDIGIKGLPNNARLLGGLDPAATGFQASFIWAYTLAPLQLRMIDLRNDIGGGIKGAREVVKWAFETYGVYEWVIESNLYHGGIRTNEKMVEYTSQRGIVLHPHDTNPANKHDKAFGVTSLAPLFDNGQIILPYGSPEAQRKAKLYLSQLIRYVGQSGTARQKSDIVLASWFPLEILRMRNVEYQRRMEHSDTGYETDLFEAFNVDDFGFVMEDFFSEVML